MMFLPNEIIHIILMYTCLEETFSKRLSKLVWKTKTNQSLERLSSVTSRWSNIIISSLLQRQLCDALDTTGTHFIIQNLSVEYMFIVLSRCKCYCSTAFLYHLMQEFHNESNYE